jgi:hypothetical protein
MKSLRNRLLILFLLLFVLPYTLLSKRIYPASFHNTFLEIKSRHDNIKQIVVETIDPYYRIRITLFGDPRRELIKLRVISKEDRVVFPAKEEGEEYFRKKWKFRGISTSQNTGRPLVEDVDKDGIPDVFFASETTKIYRLNGVSGESVWEYKLPYGVTSAISYFLADLDDDGMKEFVFGTTMSNPVRVYALKIGKNEKNRAFWAHSVGGTFFPGRIEFFSNL